jgi:hypothetical protein
VFDPAHPGSASNPDTLSPFASGISGSLIDLEVDQAGNLYYLTGSGTVEVPRSREWDYRRAAYQSMAERLGQPAKELHERVFAQESTVARR